MSITWSLIEPIYARLTPTISFAKLGQSVPGVSSSSMLSSTFTHCFPFVTPGRFPVTVFPFLQRLLIKVLLPLLGTPNTRALSGITMPLALLLSSLGLSRTFIFSATFLPLPLKVLSSVIQEALSVSNSLAQYFVKPSSARSLLFKT